MSGHSHSHIPDHDHHDGHAHSHDHAPSVTSDNERRITLVFVLTASYALIQAIGGWIAGSLALIADSGHMISDAAALLLALIAYRIARRPADLQRSYGYNRVRILAAFINGLTLLALVVWIAIEAISRFASPAPIMAWPMLIIATIGLIVNIIGAVLLRNGHQEDGNLQGAYLHVLGDLLGSVGAIGAAIGILLTGWSWLDPLLSILVALLVVRSAWSLVKRSTSVLLQSTPKGLDLAKLEQGLHEVEGVEEVGHLHVWGLSEEELVATVHVTAAEHSAPLDLPPRVAAWLQKTANISHVTVQVDPRGALGRH